MNWKEVDSELGRRELSKEKFRQELDGWFRRKGVISDLRSHLRHLMIAALQNTPMEPKSAEETSPKIQALDLVVAEYLLRRRCHYSLSVFASEVPNLNNFPGRKSRGKDGNFPGKRENAFRENEIEEIFNALGFASHANDLKRLKNNYWHESNKDSLLELFLRLILETLVKLDVQEMAKSNQIQESKIKLSAKWSSDLVDVLLNEKIPPPRIASLRNSIFSLTEIELKRLLEEERGKQMEVLTERENRIQDCLRRYEDDIFLKLARAEKELDLRKDFIDEELTQRQKDLSKMALEWYQKHEEIVKLSKNFYNLRNENESLRKEAKDLREKNENLKIREGNHVETINGLRNEIVSLGKMLKKVTESESALRERFEVLLRSTGSRDRREVSLGKDLTKQVDCETKNVETSREVEEKKEKEAEKKSETKSDLIKLQDGGGDHVTDEEEEDSSSESFTEEILSNARKKYRDLEEESLRMNKIYLEYKAKYSSIVVSESETSTESENEEVEQESIRGGQKSIFTLKLTKFCQTDSPEVHEGREEIKGTEGKGEGFIRGKKAEIKSDLEISNERIFSMKKTPTKRQLQNRDYFLKSRKLLREFEKQKGKSIFAAATTTPPSSNSSASNSLIFEERVPRSDGEKPKNKENGKSPTDGPISDTLSKIASIEKCKKIVPEVNKKAIKNGSPAFAAIDLALLNETEIKSSREIGAKKPLRQQMLAAATDDEEEDIEKSGRKERKEAETVKSPSGSTSGEKVSVGRDSGRSCDFW